MNIGATTATTGPAIEFDLDRLRASMKAMEVVMASEPIRHWMTKQGASPDDGWVLILPADLRHKVGPFPPRYVRFSPLVQAPMLIRDLLGLAT